MTTVCYFFIYIFETLISYIYFTNKFEAKYSSKITFIFFSSSFLLQFVFNQIKTPNLNLIMFLLCNFLLCFLCFKSSLLQSIFSTVILCALMIVTEFCIVYLSKLIFNIDILDYTGNDIILILQSASSKILYFILTYIISKISFKQNNFKFNAKSSLLFLLPISSILMLIGIFYVAKTNDTDNSTYILFCIATIILMYSNIIVFWVHESTIRAEQQNAELRLQQQKSEIDTAYYSILQNQYEDSNILIHDIKRHLMSIKELSESNDNDGINQYIENLYGNYDIKYIKKYSSNNLVNAIINRYLSTFKKSKIDFFCDIRDIDFSIIADNDLTAILDNLLENAFEASNKSADKKVELLIYPTNVNYVTIKINNSCKDAPVMNNGKLITTKKKSSIHGYGIKSIKRIVKNYDGDISFEYDELENNFCVKIVLKVNN